MTYITEEKKKSYKKTPNASKWYGTSRTLQYEYWIIHTQKKIWRKYMFVCSNVSHPFLKSKIKNPTETRNLFINREEEERKMRTKTSPREWYKRMAQPTAICSVNGTDTHTHTLWVYCTVTPYTRYAHKREREQLGLSFLFFFFSL